MDKIVIKTIREGFKIAFLKSLLKESSDDMAQKMGEVNLAKAEKIYPLWISGNKHLMWGTLEPVIENYLIEKAVEEYKLSKDEKIRNAIAAFYYPFEGSKIYNILSKDPLIQYTFTDKEALTDILMGAYTKTMLEPANFDKIINSYKVDSDTGIGSLFKTHIALATKGEGKTQTTQKKGGGANIKSMDSYGSNEEGDRKFDLAGGVDTDAEANAILKQLSADKLKDTFDKIKQNIEEGKVVFKNPIMKFIFTKYFEGMKPSETFANYQNDNIFDELKARKLAQKGGDLSAATKQIRNELTSWLKLYFSPTSKLFKLMNETGIENGLPSDWLEFIHNKKNKFTDIAKFIASYNKGLQEGISSEEADAEIRRILLSPPTEEELFESYVEKNMDNIIKEVYKRLNK